MLDSAGNVIVPSRELPANGGPLALSVPAGLALYLKGAAHDQNRAERFSGNKAVPPIAAGSTTAVSLTLDALTPLSAAVQATEMSSLTVTDNSTNVTVITTNAQADQHVTYAVSGGTDQRFFSIDAGSGQLSFITAPRFIAPQDANKDNVYEVQVTFSDGFESVSQDLKVTVAAAYRVFLGFDGEHAWEPWRTDGSAIGTYLLKDIVPGTSNSINETFVQGITQLNSTTFFIHGSYSNVIRPSGMFPGELWKSDGMNAGTTAIQVDGVPIIAYTDNAYINSSGGTSPVNNSVSGNFAVLNGAIFFSGRGTTGGFELWKSNGTDAGTTLVKDINPEGDSDPQCFINYSGALYFWANGGLWKTDGTNTTLVRDGLSLVLGSGGQLCMQAVFNGAIYFGLVDEVNGAALWKYSSATNSLVLVKDSLDQPVTGMDMYASGFTLFDGELYFIPSRTTSELWKLSSDGRASQATNINPTGFAYPSNFVELNGELYFTARVNNGANFQLWKIAADKSVVLAVTGIDAFGFSGLYSSLHEFNGAIYYQSRDEYGQIALWKSNGTPSGTAVLKRTCSTPPPLPNTNPESCNYMGSASRDFFELNGQLLFFTNDGVSVGLWQTNGTSEGTVKIQDICTFGTTNCLLLD